MRGQEPWQDSNKVLKINEFCIKGKPHRLKLLSLTRTDTSDDSLPTGHIKSEVVYQCTTCKKYHVEKYVYPKARGVNA